MSSVASKLSNISSEGVLAIMMGNCITHTHTHTCPSVHLVTHTYPFYPSSRFVNGRGRCGAMAL